MTIYVYRNGELVEKTERSPTKAYRFQEYESPITGATITSPRQRERDLNNSGSFDPRDLPKDHRWVKGRDAQGNTNVTGSTGQQQLDFWR